MGTGAGHGFNHNLPLPRGADFAQWRAALTLALQGIAKFGAQALVVSLGLDTFEGDPISGFKLRSDDYLRVGESIAQAGLPTVFVFEGGYAVAELGVTAVNVLEGFDQKGLKTGTEGTLQVAKIPKTQHAGNELCRFFLHTPV